VAEAVEKNGQVHLGAGDAEHGLGGAVGREAGAVQLELAVGLEALAVGNGLAGGPGSGICSRPVSFPSR